VRYLILNEKKRLGEFNHEAYEQSPVGKKTKQANHNAVKYDVV
jgi:hypothetical protein